MGSDAYRPAADVPSAAQTTESLSCTTCRSRKLKCDRVKPVCSRCAKVKGQCVYPESRRKPTVKRRNVQELEARLAQVEGMLKNARTGFEAPQMGNVEEMTLPLGVMEDFNGGAFNDMMSMGGPEQQPFSRQNSFHNNDDPNGIPGFASTDPFLGSDTFDFQLMGLGLNEPLPPFELMEALNNIYFQRHHFLVPIIHQGRYLQAFHGPPHLRPPMCLQYAIWMAASNGHEEYGQYHDLFYKRARQYADGDEMRDRGEHFLSVWHAQAWALITTDEARSMLFTRAAMSSAKCVRLVEMMGLHRLDGEGHAMAPTIAPPRDWTDVEERRRTFWGAFTIDCHASISTGWPALIDPHDIETHLPSSEEAFNACREETTFPLSEAFKGASYSTFSGAIVVCHVHNEILRHVHQVKPNDRPQDVEYGEFWKKHRELDNILTSAFMFLPEIFRLPKNLRNPTAVHTNLNLHAGVICLHHAAIDKIDTYGLPEQLRKASQARLRAAAEEIVTIVKLRSHANVGFNSPMAALSLYCAASVYIYQAKLDPQAGLSNTEKDNMEFLVRAMEAIGRSHFITKSFLQQVYMDIERNGLSDVLRMPSLNKYRSPFGWSHSNIPLLARSYLTNHTEIQTPLPGLLPLGQQQQQYQSASSASESTPQSGASSYAAPEGESAPQKRKRRQSRGQTPDSNVPANRSYLAYEWDTPATKDTPPLAKSGKGRGVFGGGLLRAASVTSAGLAHRSNVSGTPSDSTHPPSGNALPNDAAQQGQATMGRAHGSACDDAAFAFSVDNCMDASTLPQVAQGLNSAVPLRPLAAQYGQGGTQQNDNGAFGLDPLAFVADSSTDSWNP